VKKKNILITGPSGLVGTKIISKFLNLEYNLICIYRNVVPKDFRNIKKIRWVKCDLENEEFEIHNIKKFYAAILLCGQTNNKNISSEQYIKSNVITLQNTLNSIGSKTDRIIFASTQYVYGNPNNLNIKESHKTQSEFNSYSFSKLRAENILKQHQKKFYGMYISFRLPGFIGGGGNIDYIINKAKKNEDIILFSNGSVCRDYITFDYAFDIIAKTLSQKIKNGFFIFNVGSGQKISSIDIAKKVCKTTNSKSKIILSDKKPEIEDCILNNNKLRRFIDIKNLDLSNEIISHALNHD
tara:strand:+ start:650 stop:1540 length:891 start_codon:yes stop_codon:yes gene_type:complete